MRLILIFCLVAFLSSCQASGSTNGHRGNASIMTNILSLEF